MLPMTFLLQAMAQGAVFAIAFAIVTRRFVGWGVWVTFLLLGGIAAGLRLSRPIEVSRIGVVVGELIPAAAAAYLSLRVRRKGSSLQLQLGTCFVSYLFFAYLGVWAQYVVDIVQNP
jgi:hypothetical protein